MARRPNPGDAGIVLLLTVVVWTSLPPVIGGIGFALPALAYAAMMRMDFTKTFFFRRLPIKTWTPVLMCSVGVTGAIMLLASLMEGLFPVELEKLQESVDKLPWFTLTLIPATCEEILFRGFFLSICLVWAPPWRAVLYTAVLFGGIHALPSILPVTLLGVSFAVVVLLTRSLWAGIIAHLVNNSAALLLMALEKQGTDLAPIILIAAPLGALAALVGFAWLAALRKENHRDMEIQKELP